MTRPTLTVIVDHQIISRMTLTTAVTLGRLADNTLVLSDTSVSGHHGRIDMSAQGWRYTDLGSSNGSLIAAGPQLGRGEHFIMNDVTQILLGATVLEFDPKDEGQADEHRGGTSVSFEKPPSADVQRRGSGSRGKGAAPSSSIRPRGHIVGESTAGLGSTAGDFRAADDRLAHGAESVGPGSGRLVPDHPHQGPPRKPVAGGSATPPLQIDPPGKGASAGLAGTASQTPPAPPQPIKAPILPATSAASGLTPPPRMSGPATRGHPPSSPSAPVSAAVAAEPPTRPMQAKTRAIRSEVNRPRVLVVLGDTVTTVELEKPINVLGRNRHCDVVIDDASVSSRHAEISYRDKRWMVRDLGSTNGTRLGLVRLEEPHELLTNGHLILGIADLLFIHDGQARADALDGERFLSWLRRRRKVTRAQARLALSEAARSGRSVGEVLVKQGVLKPGSLTELSHNASLGSGSGRRIPAYAWGLAVLLAAAVTALAVFS